eukprot:2069291-Karenia_brevis.AAC.1
MEGPIMPAPSSMRTAKSWTHCQCQQMRKHGRQLTRPWSQQSKPATVCTSLLKIRRKARKFLFRSV